MNEQNYQIDLLTAMNKKLSESEQIYRMICETSSSAFLFYSFANKHFQVVGNWDSYFEIDMNSILDTDKLPEFVEEDVRERFYEVLHAEESSLNIDFCECKILDKKKWIRCETTCSYDDEMKPVCKIIRFTDITSDHVKNENLEYMAFYDMLTGQYNRNYFISKLNEWIIEAQKANCKIAVMYMDIDEFRKINDGLGMLVGDELVQIFGQFLNSLSDEKIMTSHINGDVYCIAIYDPCGVRSVDMIYRRIREYLEKPIVTSMHQEIPITVTVGVAEYPEASQSSVELLNNAEIMMYKAKYNGKNCIQYFDAPVMNDFMHVLKVEKYMKNAINENRYSIYYQPQFDAIKKRLRGAEALIRLRDEQGKLVPPSEFIPIAEKNGSIVEIGSWVLEEAVKTYAQWQRKYGVSFVMSINISALEYKKPDFVDRVMGVLKRYGVEPDCVELEITETVLIDDFNEIVHKMQILRDYGIRVSLDDFGTGYSSLSYLKDLPINTLKIDKSFLDTVMNDSSTRIITESIVQMVKKLGFETVAEGVETEEQFEYMREINCDNIQGFLLGKPLPTEQFEQLLISEM